MTYLVFYIYIIYLQTLTDFYSIKEEYYRLNVK
jgi:hypothetical protein